jgi:hypothetical protein
METTTTQPVTVPDVVAGEPVDQPVVGMLSTGTAAASPRDFADGLKSAIVATSTDQTREILTGVLISRCPDRHVVKGEYVPTSPDTVTMVATDSYRLHRVDVVTGADVAAVFAEPVILPAKDLANVAKLFAGKGVSVATVSRVTVPSAYGGERQRPAVTFASPYDGTSVTVAAIKGEYPRWENLLPDVDNCQPSAAAYDPDKLAAVCKGAGIVAGKHGGIVRCRGSIEGSELKPNLFTAARDNLTFTGLLMPVRLPS